jgi:hypothetical protein
MLCDNAPPNKSPQPTGPVGPRCIDALESTAPIGARKQRRSCICWQSCGGVDFAGPAPQLYAAGRTVETGEVEQFTTQYAVRTGTMKRCIGIVA